MLEWSEQFETGHALIDAQHKQLISYSNRLGAIAHNSNPNRQEAEFILHFIDFLETYVHEHFQQEEACMESYRCPALQENKLAHREFLVFFGQFKERFMTGGFRPEALTELSDFCGNWIKRHILQIDMRLKPCLHADDKTNPPG